MSSSPGPKSGGGDDGGGPPASREGARPPPPPPIPPPPMPPPSPPREPRKRTSRAVMRVAYFFWPVSLSSHVSVRSEPSTYTCRPFSRYLPQLSACLPHTSTLCHSVRSWRCPALSVNTSVVAMRRLHTVWPDGSCFSSGLAPRLPMRMTL